MALLLALGHSKNHSAARGAALLTFHSAPATGSHVFPLYGYYAADNPVYGITILLWGQVAASFCHVGIFFLCHSQGCRGLVWSFCKRYAAIFCPDSCYCSVYVCCVLACRTCVWLKLLVEVLVGALLYFGVNKVLGSRIQQEVFGYLRGGKIAA